MYWIDNEKGDELRRNTLSIRLTDKEHEAICNVSWVNKVSASSMIRELVFSGMVERGLIISKNDLSATNTENADKPVNTGKNNGNRKEGRRGTKR